MKSETYKTKPFRVHAKKFLLTYSQVPEKMTPDSVIDQLQQQIEVSEYVVGIEYHEDGGKHFYVILISSRKQDIRSAAKFTIHFQGKAYSCNYTGVKNCQGQ